MRQSRLHEEPLYEGCREVLDRLHARDDVLMAMATGKSQRGVRALLEREGLEGYFQSIQTADDAPSKPHPAMIFQALADTGGRTEATVMVGDRLTLSDVRSTLKPGEGLAAELTTADGATRQIRLTHALSAEDVALVLAGGRLMG